MQIEYIAQYFVKEAADITRNFSLSGVAKMDYYLSVLNELGYTTMVYSTCATNRRGFQKAETTTNNLGQSVFYRSSFGSNNPKIKYMDLIFGKILLFFHLVFSRNCNNKIFIAYHERLYTPIIRLASKVRKLNIIIDVEELYSVAANLPRNRINKEIQSLSINNAGYIFPTHRLRKILEHSLNICISSFVTCSGNYLVNNKIRFEGGASISGICRNF